MKRSTEMSSRSRRDALESGEVTEARELVLAQRARALGERAPRPG